MILAITLLAFLIMHLAPGDATSAMFNPKMTAQDKAFIQHQLGLDLPLWKQYLHWMSGVLKGDWGVSYVSGEAVTTLIGQRLGPTLILSLSSLLVTLCVSIPIGIWSAYRAGTGTDEVITGLSVIGIALPTFWLGLILVLVFAVWMPFFPSSGWMEPGLETESLAVRSISILHHLALPLLTLVVANLGSWVRYQRVHTLTILKQPFIHASKARGFSTARILTRHVLKNTLLPMITLLGLELPGIFSGAFIVEHIFSWPGMGQLGIQAVFARDYPVIMGLLLVSASLMVIGNRVADWAYAWVDPRVKL